MKKQRKLYAPEEKVAILRRHLLEKGPISKLCVKSEYAQSCKPTIEEGAMAESWGFVNTRR
jgi:hypothetical protein